MRLFFSITAFCLFACTNAAPVPPSPLRDAEAPETSSAYDAESPSDANAESDAPDASALPTTDASSDSSSDASSDASGDASDNSDADDAGETARAWFTRESSALCLGCDFSACVLAWTGYLQTTSRLGPSAPRPCVEIDATECMYAEVATNALTCTPGPSTSLAYGYAPCVRCNAP